MEKGNKQPSYPLCVDLDGTLVHSDTLFEVALNLLKKRPWMLFVLFRWLRQGKATLKHKLSLVATIDPTLLPYNQPFLDWLKAEHKKGRELCLATASHLTTAQKVADHLGIFSRVIGSDEANSLSGKQKATALVAIYGPKGFAYAGNSQVDIPVWKEAAEAVVVQAHPGVVTQAESVAKIAKVFPDTRGLLLLEFWKAIRPHQWLKNLLLFVPLITAHEFTNTTLLQRAVIAFVIFSLIASTVYLINDLMDLEADRQHIKKRLRPLAAGTLPIVAAAAGVAILLLLSATLAFFLPLAFIGVVVLYLAVNLSYSLALKQIPYVDVVLLASLYVVRLVAGSVATGVPISRWLLIFALFIFISLALVKRCSELSNLKKQNKIRAHGRGYTVHALGQLRAAGRLSGYASLVVFMFYINSSTVMSLYEQPAVLWFLLPLFFYWISRMWRLATEGKMNEDPIAFAAHDYTSYIVGASAFFLLLAAT